MGTPGVPWDMPKETIVEVLKRNKGRVNPSSKQLCCSPTTLYRFIDRDPEVQELVEYLQRWGHDERTDDSEDILDKALKDADIKVALTAAFYHLNTSKYAKKRGWTGKIEEQKEITQELNRMIVLEKENADLQAKIAELQAKLPLDHNDSRAAAKLLQEAPDKSQSNDPVQS